VTTAYPGAIDALTNPTASDQLTSPSHAGQHANANDAIEAIETELGVDPAGAYASVVARLDAADAAVVALDAEYGVGNAFPGSPTEGDRFWRTDKRMEFYFDGTRWLTVNVYSDPAVDFEASTQPLTATTSTVARWVTPNVAALGCSDIWVESIDCSFYITGGTALSASHKWTCTTSSAPSAGPLNGLTFETIDGGSSDVWRQTTFTVNALLGGDFIVAFGATKTGTPGDLRLLPRVAYRFVAT
jgi:hypothetical protein